jgi:stage II sporulation protein D
VEKVNGYYRFLLLLLAAVLFPVSALCDDQNTYKISVLSEFKPTDISVYFPGDEDLVLAVDEDLHPEHAISGDQHFEISLSEAGIVVVVASDDGKTIKKKVVDINSRISFSTAISKKTYNKYALEVNGRSKKEITGTIRITHIMNDFLILAFIRKERVIAEFLDVEAGVYRSDEALKAQALIARTILAAKEGSHLSGKYDLCDLEHCREYRHRGTATKRALKAVRATNGQIITHLGDMITPYFFHTCGGHTALASVSSGTNDMLTPYIKEVKCDYCVDSKYYRYKKRIKRDALSRVFLGRDDESFDLEVVKKDKNDHWVDSVKVSTSTYSYEVKGSKFMRLVKGALWKDALPSGAFSIRKKGDEFIFSGKGKGAGVGLCQSGADKMATMDFNYRKIIRFYFPAVKVEKISDIIKR